MDPLPFADHRARVAFSVAVGLFAVLQAATGLVAAVRRRRAKASHVRLDRGTLPVVLLLTVTGFFASALCAFRVGGAAMGFRWPVFAVGIFVIVAGAALRLWAIVTLGRWFTYDVRVAEGQPVVTTGPYRWVRHPSYTGVLLVLIGIGLTLGNWLSLLLISTVPTVGLVLRVRVEERALRRLGPDYADYAATRARLIPGVW